MQVGKDAVVIEADAIKNRDVMFKHLSSNDFTKDDPMLSSYVHEYSTKAAEMLLAAAGDMLLLQMQEFIRMMVRDAGRPPHRLMCLSIPLMKVSICT